MSSKVWSIVGPHNPVEQHIGGSKNSTSAGAIEVGRVFNKGMILLMIVFSPVIVFGVGSSCRLRRVQRADSFVVKQGHETISEVLPYLFLILEQKLA